MAKAIDRFDKTRAEYPARVTAAAEVGQEPPPPPTWMPPTNTLELHSMREQIEGVERAWIEGHRAELLDALLAEEAAWLLRR